MTHIDLHALAANHVEAQRRRWPHEGSACRACAQPWPCDAAQLTTELLMREHADDGRFAVLWSGSTVLLVFRPGHITPTRAAELKAWLVSKRPDIEWLIVEADDLVALAAPTEEADAHQNRTQTGSQAGEEGRQEDRGRQARD